MCSLDGNSLNNGVTVSLRCISQFCFLFTLNIVYLIESSNEGQFAFTVESIVMVQKLRGTLTYVIKVLYNIISCRRGGETWLWKGRSRQVEGRPLGSFYVDFLVQRVWDKDKKIFATNKS